MDCILPGIYTGTECNDTGLHAVFPGEGRRDGSVIAIKSHSIPHYDENGNHGNQNKYIFQRIPWIFISNVFPKKNPIPKFLLRPETWKQYIGNCAKTVQ